jgi:hypothetical protein
MRRGIGVVVGLDLNDTAAHALEQYCCPDQAAGDLVHAWAEEGPAQAFWHPLIVAGPQPDGNSRVNQTGSRRQICGSNATALEHLIVRHRSHPKRRFLAIGFFDIDECDGRTVDTNRCGVFDFRAA